MAEKPTERRGNVLLSFICDCNANKLVCNTQQASVARREADPTEEVHKYTNVYWIEKLDVLNGLLDLLMNTKECCYSLELFVIVR